MFKEDDEDDDEDSDNEIEGITYSNYSSTLFLYLFKCSSRSVSVILMIFYSLVTVYCAMCNALTRQKKYQIVTFL